MVAELPRQKETKLRRIATAPNRGGTLFRAAAQPVRRFNLGPSQFPSEAGLGKVPVSEYMAVDWPGVLAGKQESFE